MVTYIVGMIVGMISLVFPLVYWMHLDSCNAQILAYNPSVSVVPLEAQVPAGVLLGTSVLGAVVLLLSAAMMAFTGLKALKDKEEVPSSPPESEPQSRE